MTDKATSAPVETATVAAAEEEAPKVKTTKRSDAAQVFVQQFLAGHGVTVSAFSAEDAVALVAAIDAAK